LIVGYRFLLSGQSGWQGRPDFSANGRPTQQKEIQAQGPNGLACPGLDRKLPRPNAIVSRKNRTHEAFDRVQEAHRR